MAYLLTQIFWCLLATAILFFVLGWLVRHWFPGKKADDYVIASTEKTSWQISLDIMKARLELETEQKEQAQKALRALTSPQAPPPQGDDLKKIKGIGPALEKRLNALGVFSFREIALWSMNDVGQVEGQLQEFRKRIERDKWIESAREEHFKKYGERLASQ
jgi:predicted flap endonuclease-1-like 5' DNA nuclease